MNGPFRTKPVASKHFSLVGWRAFRGYAVLSVLLLACAPLFDLSFLFFMAGILGCHWLGILLLLGSTFRTLELGDGVVTLSRWLRYPIRIHRDDVVLRTHGGRVTLDTRERISVGLGAMGKGQANELITALGELLGYEGETERAALRMASDRGGLNGEFGFDLITDPRDTFLRFFLGATSLSCVAIALATPRDDGVALPLCMAVLLAGSAFWLYLSTPRRLVLSEGVAVISYRSGGKRTIAKADLLVRRDSAKATTVIHGISIQDRVLTCPREVPRLIAALSGLCGYDVTDPAGEAARFLREAEES